jgi:hypothetical protein
MERDPNLVRHILGALYRGEMDGEHAVAELENHPRESAEWIVDAFNRQWVSNWNLGLNEEGEEL